MTTPVKVVPPEGDYSAPPPYDATDYRLPMPVAEGKLPTYEEVQIEKGELPGAAPPFRTVNLAGLGNGGPTGTVVGLGGPAVGPNGAPALTFIAIDATDPESLTASDINILGTDLMFVAAFLVSFLFNWVGFLMVTCFCHTIAARYGALSGFGLSLAKWTLIVKNSTDLASHENAWLWWLIMAFGFLICVRALVQYVSIKRTWGLLTPHNQEQLLYFY